MKYYKLNKLLKTNSDYNIIVGGRANGKSYAIGMYIIDDFFKNGHSFLFIKRYELDITQTVLERYFSEKHRNYCIEKYGYDIVVISRKWYLVNVENDKDRKLLGECFSLNMQERYKSGQYEHIYNIVFEEFILTNQSDYIQNETDLFLSLISTVCRHRNVKVFLVGNTISKYNPYFTLFGIDIDTIKLKSGDIYTFKSNEYSDGAKISIEYAKMPYEKEKEIPKILRIGNNEIATTGEFTHDIRTVLDFKQWLKDNYITLLEKSPIFYIQDNFRNFKILVFKTDTNDYIYYVAEYDYKTYIPYGDKRKLKNINLSILGYKQLFNTYPIALWRADNDRNVKIFSDLLNEIF